MWCVVEMFGWVFFVVVGFFFFFFVFFNEEMMFSFWFLCFLV